MPPIINQKLCTGCGVCANICPQDVFYGSRGKEAPTVTYPDECWHCNACVLDCPKEGAIQLRIPLPMLVCYK
jgi:adenylylsulfate reductase, subunit B